MSKGSINKILSSLIFILVTWSNYNNNRNQNTILVSSILCLVIGCAIKETYGFSIHYMRISVIVYPVKMEYGTEINISVLKMMMKSGLERTILTFIQGQSLFWKLFFTS